MSFMNASAPSAKTSFTGFLRYLATGNKLTLLGYVALAVVVFPLSVIVWAITFPMSAYNPPTEDETPWLISLVTRSWTRYKESLSK